MYTRKGLTLRGSGAEVQPDDVGLEEERMEYHLRISGATLVLHENGSSSEEVSSLLTARFGAMEAPASKAVALEDLTTSLVFPLDVVAVRPDFVSQSENLKVLFSCSAETALLNQLKQKRLLTEQEIRTLTPLLEDPYVTAAFEVFREEGDQADLVDTLHRIVAIRLSGGGGAGRDSSSTPSLKPAAAPTIATRAAPHAAKEDQLAGNALLEQLTAALKLEEYPQEELKSLCGQLRGQGKLSAEDEAVLAQLVNKQLPHLQAAFEIYLEEEDESAFLNSVKRVARHYGVERVVRGQPYAKAILEAFGASNPMVCGAWDVYVDEHNEEDFRDTLARIYRRLSSSRSGAAAPTSAQSDAAAAAASRAIYSDKPSDAKAALRRFVLWLHTQNKISTGQGQALMALVDAGSPEAEKAMEEYLRSPRQEEDGDRLMEAMGALLEDLEDPGTDEDLAAEDEGEDGRRPLEETYGENPEEDEVLRESITLFLEDLCDEKGVLSEESVEKLKSLVDVGDHRLLAAFDLFREEQDLEDLVDTLQRLAEKVVLVGGNSGGNEEEEDAEGAYDEDLLHDVISDMGLSLAQLELIRDAMAMRHPELEHAIDLFARTHDAKAFKRDLLEFCATARQ